MICCSKFGDWWFDCGCHVQFVIVDVMFWVCVWASICMCEYMHHSLFVKTFVCSCQTV